MTNWLTRIIAQLCSPWGRVVEVEPDVDDIRATEATRRQQVAALFAARRNIGVTAAWRQASIWARRRP